MKNYEELVERLEKAVATFDKSGKAITALMEDIDNSLADAGAKETAHIQLLLNDLTASIKTCSTPTNKILEPIKNGIMATKMENEGLEKADFEGIGKVVLTGDIFCSMITDKKDDAYAWLIDQDQADMIQSTVNSSALKSFIKKAISSGEIEVPEELFKVTPYTRSSIRKK